MIERFEFYPQFVIDERIMILYFSALQRVNKLHTFNLASFIKRLNKNSGSGSGVAVQMDPLKYATLMELHESIKNTGVAAANGGTTTTTTTTTTSCVLVPLAVIIITTALAFTFTFTFTSTSMCTSSTQTTEKECPYMFFLLNCIILIIFHIK